MAETFARVETKFLLSQSQAEALETELWRRRFVRMDFGSPRVQSLYYDTPDYALIRASLSHPAYKEKLRLRGYGEPGTIVQSYLEIKKKYDGVVYKRRTAMPLREAVSCLARGVIPEEAGQVGREIQWMLRRYELRPAAVIAYDRNAWFCQDEPGLRVTFDRNLMFRDWDMDLNARTPGIRLLPSDRQLLEIKTGGAYPLWLCRLLREIGAERTHFSKYGLAYQRYIQPDQEGIERSGANCSTVSLSRGA